jgi:hypothetical protein
VVRRRLTDDETMREFFKVFGPRRAVELLGWMTVWSIRGKPSLRSVVKAARELRTGRTTVYRFIRDMKLWREHVAELEGRQLEPIEGLDELAVWFQHNVQADAARVHA